MTAFPSNPSAPPVERQRESKLPLLEKPLYLLPAFGLMLTFVVIPTAVTIAIGFTDWELGLPDFSFIGFENYTELFTNPDYRKSLFNTLMLNCFVVPTSLGISLALALAINSLSRFQGFWQTVFFLPVTTSLVAMSIVWRWMLHPQFGLVNRLLEMVGLQSVNWLNNQSTVLFAIGCISIWQLVGYYMVLFLAGLIAIPKNLYEAAKVDGASSSIDRFIHVTWPMLGPTSLFVFVIVVIKSFQIFDTVKVLTQGDPNKASEIMLYTLYSEGFQFFRMGIASAVATVFFVIMLLLTLYQMRMFERHVHY
ncbi:MAG: sugar ABC transporter permease [Cyanobacteria bacterium P01_A01_bin.3]